MINTSNDAVIFETVRGSKIQHWRNTLQRAVELGHLHVKLEDDYYPTFTIGDHPSIKEEDRKNINFRRFINHIEWECVRWMEDHIGIILHYRNTPGATFKPQDYLQTFLTSMRDRRGSLHFETIFFEALIRSNFASHAQVAPETKFRPELY